MDGSKIGSVSVWLEELKEGDESKGQQLWNRYVEKLVRLARQKMGGMSKRVADEEDLVAAAFTSFFLGVRSGRFSKLESREDFWQVLVMLTERRIIDQRRHHATSKRGNGQVRGESVFRQASETGLPPGFSSIADENPTPEFAISFIDEIAAGMKKLRGDKLLTQIVLLKLQECTNAEIASEVGCSLSTVERKVRLIRDLWAN